LSARILFIKHIDPLALYRYIARTHTAGSSKMERKFFQLIGGWVVAITIFVIGASTGLLEPQTQDDRYCATGEPWKASGDADGRPEIK